MWVEVPVSVVTESDVQILAAVLLVEGESALQLDLHEGFAIDMLGDEISALPIIRKAQRHVPEVGQYS